MMSTGNYDVWVWATGKDGNKKIERVLSSVHLEFPGDVVISKDADKVDSEDESQVLKRQKGNKA